MSDMFAPAGNGAPQDVVSPGDLIRDSATATFKQDVIDESRNQPVLVDFWAPWCGPCKQLTPLLEKTVTEAGGAVKLVKVNVDENQALAGQMGIQSIPAVFAFKDGRPVDGFMGALPEGQIKEFIARLGADAGADEAQAMIDAAAEALAAGDAETAARGYAAVLQADPQNADAIGGLTQCYITFGDLDNARTTLALAGPDILDKAPIAGARAALKLAEQAGETGDADALRAAVEKDPNDYQARFDLAAALNARGDREGAAGELLEIVRRKRDWNDEAARKQLLEFFDAWGPTDEATLSGRRGLSSLLFS